MIIVKESMKDNLGKCYELSYKWVLKKSNYKLVHGYISQRGTNITIDHAWTEIEDDVYDPVMEQIFLKDIYYALFDAEPSKIYTKQQAIQKALKSGHYGPWHKIPKGKIKHPDYKGD